MAGVFDPNKDNEDNQQNADQNEPLSVSGGESNVIQPETGANVRGGSYKSRAPTQSGRFVNIQNYLKSNVKGAEGLGKGIEAGAEKVAQRGRQELTTQKSSIEPELSQAEAKTSELQGQTEGLGTQLGSKETFQPAFEKLTSTLDFTKNLQPHGLAAPENITQAASKFQSLANLGKTDTGRQQLLQQTYQRPSYTQGQINLDNLLLSASKGGSGAIQRLQAAAPELQKELVEQGVGGVNQRVANIAQGGQNLQTAALGQAQLGEEAIKNQLTDLAKAYIQNEQNRAENFQLPNQIMAQGTLQGLPANANFGNFASVIDPNQLRDYIKYTPGAKLSDLEDPGKLNALLSRAGAGGEASQFNKLASILGQEDQLLSENAGPLQQGAYDVNQQGINQAYNQNLNDIFNQDQGFSLQGYRYDDATQSNVPYNITNPAEAYRFITSGGIPNQSQAQAELGRLQQYITQKAAQRMGGGAFQLA